MSDSDDWRVGDLALCLRREPWSISGAKGPRCGQIFTVEAVEYDLTGGKGLILKDCPSKGYHGGWRACNFRKIRPHTPDAEDLETIELLNSAPVDALRREALSALDAALAKTMGRADRLRLKRP